MALPVLPDVLRVYVGPQLAAESIPNDTQSCVFAKALLKKTGYVFQVGAKTAATINYAIYYDMSEKAKEQVLEFDKTGRVVSGHYTFRRVK